MQQELQSGIKGHQEMTVTPSDTAIAYGSGQVAVFATPAMITLMEKTAHLSLQPHLPEGFTTVGSEVNIRHLKASPVGSRIWAETLLTLVEGKKLTFTVRAFDTQGEIGNGTHTRYLVHAEKFMKGL